MDIVLLIIGCISMIFSWCFLVAAVLTFAVHDRKPLNDTTRTLLIADSLFGGGKLVVGFAIWRGWKTCPQARNFLLTGFVFAAVAAAAGIFAMR